MQHSAWWASITWLWQALVAAWPCLARPSTVSRSPRRSVTRKLSRRYQPGSKTGQHVGSGKATSCSSAKARSAIISALTAFIGQWGSTGIDRRGGAYPSQSRYRCLLPSSPTPSGRLTSYPARSLLGGSFEHSMGSMTATVRGSPSKSILLSLPCEWYACLNVLASSRALPQVIRTDNGPEFLAEAFTRWAKDHGVALQYIPPGQPNQNAYIERFNRTYREELLDRYWFTSLDDVREATYWWMREYNEPRPHGALGDMTPKEYLHLARASNLQLSS